MLTAFACGANQFITYGLINFAVLFLMREKDMKLSQVAIYYALVVLIGMGGGMLASGPVIDRFTRRSKRAYALVPAATLTLAVPFYLAFVWTPAWHLALVFLACNDVSELLLSHIGRHPGAGGGAARPACHVRRSASADHESDRSRPGPNVCGRGQRLLPRKPSPSLIADSHFTCSRRRTSSLYVVSGVGACASKRRSYRWRNQSYDLTPSLARLVGCIRRCCSGFIGVSLNKVLPSATPPTPSTAPM